MFKVLIGKISFVGLISTSEDEKRNSNLKKGILTPLDGTSELFINKTRKDRLNFEYIQDYNVFKDIGLIFKKIGLLGREI